MSVYYTNEKSNYKLNFDYDSKTKTGGCDCSTIIDDTGKERLLHNEVSFSFELKENGIHVFDGWHIGTEDFDFSEEDGDDCNYYVEEYHPGLLKQLKKEIENMNNNTTNNNGTKVICPNCGTTFALPEHEHACVGMVIGKDSGLGNIYLTPETIKNENNKETKTMNKAQERLEALKAAGYNTDSYMVVSGSNGDGFLFKNENGIPVPVSLDEEIVTKINEGGYVFNRFTNPRWITAQMFQMLRYKGWREEGNGYEASLNRKGYGYQFSFLKDEIHRLAKMEKDNDPTFQTRAQFFTIEVIGNILDDYYYMLKKHVEYIKPRKCKGITYKRIPFFKYGNDGKGDVFVADIDKKVFYPIRNKIYEMKRVRNYEELDRLYSKFFSTVYLPLSFGGKKQSKVFRDTYKGMGAYYTCDNLIKFHGCFVKDEYGTVNQERSLAILNAKAKEYKGNYWRLFAFMKKLVEDNGFNPDWN